MTTMVQKACLACGKEFQIAASELRKSRAGRYCSHSCAGSRNNRQRIDLTGKKFGRLTVVRHCGDGYWLVHYDCGTSKTIFGDHLRRGASSSCGCLAIEMLVERCKTHGMRHSPEWQVWSAMRYRCFNPRAKAYLDYGGRGITVCDEWLNSFEAFYRDMGPRPGPGWSIDRIDNNGNYEPRNCRWVQDELQEHNKRSNRLLEFNGNTYPLSVLARMHGLTPGCLGDRLSYGWPLQKALTTPTRKRRRPCLQQSK